MAPSALSLLSQCQDTYPGIDDYAKDHWALSTSIFKDPVSITETFPSHTLWKNSLFFLLSALALFFHPEPRKGLGPVSCFNHHLETTYTGKARPWGPIAPHSHNCLILSMSFVWAQFLHSPPLIFHITVFSQNLSKRNYTLTEGHADQPQQSQADATYSRSCEEGPGSETDSCPALRLP